MTLNKHGALIERRYLPARELAARATSKHGNPADYAIVCSADVPSAADIVAPRVYSEAYGLDDLSHHGGISVYVGTGAAEPSIGVVIDVAPNPESILDRGGFSLAFAPRSPRDVCPRFEGQIRVDHVDAANSRVVAQGRYTGFPDSPATDDLIRETAESALRQIVGLLTASLVHYAT